MSKKIDVVAIGEAMIEFNQTDPGEPVYRQGFGGDTSNVVIAASRQGASAAYLSRVGNDGFGARLRDLWQRERVDISAVALDAEAPTGVYFVSHGPEGHQFNYLRAGSAASRLAPANVDLQVIGEARWLHVSAISQAISLSACDAVFEAIRHARQTGTLVSYDPNLRLRLWPYPRAQAVILATIPQVDLFLPSLEEARLLSGQQDAYSILDWCMQQNVPRVVLKCGAQGAWVCEVGAMPAHVPGNRAQAVDATGAGDCFDGALLARLAAGDSLYDAARYANACAALSTLGFGAIEPVPYREHVLDFMRSGASALA
jgi:2-dehydro-3-deoxygluconokinase